MDLSNAVLAAVSSPSSSTDVKALSISTYTAALQQLATYSAAAGASMSELEQALDRNRSLKVNLEQANSRIADTDIAAESTRLAKANVLVQSGSNAVVKANQSKDALLRLLGI
jgi:flagellin